MSALAPTFGAALGSEWLKLRTVRSTYALPVLACLGTLGLTVAICAFAGSAWSGLSATDKATFDPTHSALEAMSYGNIAFIAFGVYAVGAEYSSGMIRTSLTMTPRRGRFLLAKCMPLTVGAFAVGVVLSVAVTAVGLAVLSGRGAPTPSLTDSAVLRAMFCSGLTTAFLTLGGATVAFGLRSTIGAAAVVNTGAFLPSSLSFLPDSLQRYVVRFLPTNATDSLTRVVVDVHSPTHLATGPALGLVAVWAVLAVIGARSTLSRRDG